MTLSRNNLILIIIAVLVLLVAAYLFFGKNDAKPGVAGQPGPTSEAELTFINLTAQMDPVSFDTSVLDNPYFLALRDIKTAILPENTGRMNPFAPLAGVATKK